MPFPLISTVLGLCFFLLWLLIAVMIFWDGQSAVRRERELQQPRRSALPTQAALPRPHWAHYDELRSGEPLVENA